MRLRQLLTSFPILAFVSVDLVARPTSLQNGPLAKSWPVHPRELLMYRSPINPPHTTNSGSSSLAPPPSTPHNAQQHPSVDPGVAALLNGAFFRPNIMALIDMVAILTWKVEGLTTEQRASMQRLRPLIQDLHGSYFLLHCEYMVLSSDHGSAAQAQSLYRVDLNTGHEQFSTLTRQICYTHGQPERKRRDAIHTYLQQHSRRILIDTERWTVEHGWSIRTLVQAVLNNLVDFCAAIYTDYHLP